MQKKKKKLRKHVLYGHLFQSACLIEMITAILLSSIVVTGTVYEDVIIYLARACSVVNAVFIGAVSL